MRNLIVVTTVLSLSGVAAATAVAPEWRYSQEIQAPQKGLNRFQLSLETLSNAQPTRADIRLMDPAGREISYLVDQPVAVRPREMPLEKMTILMVKGKTIITGRIPDAFLPGGVDAIHLYTATDDFLKPLTLEVSPDLSHWTAVVTAYPLFKQPGESWSSAIEIPKKSGPFLRVTLDDATTPPIRVQGVQVYAAPARLPNLQTVALHVLETSNDAHQTEIQALLPADNLLIDTLRIETADGTFRRLVRVSVKTFAAGEFRETLLGQGAVYRVALNQKKAKQDSFFLGRQVPGRQLIVRIENGDSQPLAISRITAEVTPAYLVFDAPAAGAYDLWVGNGMALPKNYDLSSLREPLEGAVFLPATAGPLTANPAYRAPDPLPQAVDQGTDIDVASWRYRKKLTLPPPDVSAGPSGIYRVEPDIQVLAHNGNRLPALRLVQKGRQIPYIVDYAGVSRDLDVQIGATPDKGSVSQWVLTFPEKGLPLNALQFTVQETLFQRNLMLYEEVLDERGDTQKQMIGQASWVRSTDKGPERFMMTLYRPLRADKLLLETDNRDNPPIHLLAAKGYYQTPRLLLKTTPDKETYLYYGNEDVAAPEYDLNLIAAQVLAQAPLDARLGAEEVLKVKPWWEAPVPTGGMKFAFWILMAAVVAGLLVVIAKLLPEPQEDK